MVLGRKGAARIAVLTIIDEEFTAVQRVFNTMENISGTSYFVERISPESPPQYQIIVRKAGNRGNHAAGEAVGGFVEDFRPEVIFLVGIAGGVGGRDETNLGDVIIGDYVAYSEFRKLSGGKSLPRYLPYDHPSLYLRENFAEPLRRTDDWIEFIDAARPDYGTPKAIVGNIVAGEKLLGDPTSEYQKQILEDFDTALAVDMESFGVGREAFRARSSVHYNPQYLVIRGISDLTNTAEDNEQERKRWKNYAAAAAAAFSCALASTLLEAHYAKPPSGQPLGSTWRTLSERVRSLIWKIK